MKNERTYTTGEVAKRIKVEPVTVRKYAQLLEEKGYKFEKDKKGWRRFAETDLQSLEHFSLLRSSGLSVEETVENVAYLYHQNLFKITTDTTIQKHESELKNFIDSQISFNQKIIERLDQQEKRQAERDENLTMAMRGILDNKKQMASAKQKRWWRFWK